MTTPAITGDSTITIGSISSLFAAHQINQGYIMNTLKKLCSMQYSINDQRKIEISGTEF